MRNNRDCKVVDPYKARKRYTVAESLNLIVSVKQRNPIRIFLNWSVMGGIRILTQQTVIWELECLGVPWAWIVSAGSSIKLQPEIKGTVIWPSVAMSDCFGGFVTIFFGGFLDQITNYDRKKQVQLSGPGGTVGYPAQPGITWRNRRLPSPTRINLVSVRPSFCPSVRAKKGIWSKRVFMRTNGNFSFSLCWRNTTIIH